MDNGDKIVKQLERLNSNVAELTRAMKETAKSMKVLADTQKNTESVLTHFNVNGMAVVPPIKETEPAPMLTPFSDGQAIDYHRDLGHLAFVKAAMLREHDERFINDICSTVFCQSRLSRLNHA